MEQNSYEVKVSQDRQQYWFVSSGKNGDITKVVTMQTMKRAGRFNLALADEINGKLDYKSKTDNGDLDYVFATISEIVIYFTKFFPASEIFITGNTPVKTRLYQMKVSNNLEWINNEFEVFGMTDESGNGDFTPFKMGINYKGILVTRK